MYFHQYFVIESRLLQIAVDSEENPHSGFGIKWFKQLKQKNNYLS